MVGSSGRTPKGPSAADPEAKRLCAEALAAEEVVADVLAILAAVHVAHANDLTTAIPARAPP